MKKLTLLFALLFCASTITLSSFKTKIDNNISKIEVVDSKIVVKVPEQKDYKIKIIDSAGECVYSYTFNKNKAFLLNELPDGDYSIVLLNTKGKNVDTKKFTVVSTVTKSVSITDFQVK